MAAILLPVLFLPAQVRAQSALDGFDPNANGRVRVAAVQPDGKILIGGDFTTLSPNGGAAVTRNRIARLNPDGTLDTAFDPNANGFVHSIVLQADGKILVGGRFNGTNCIGGQSRSFIARLDPATGLADSFNANPNAEIHAIAVQADGKILVGGQFDVIGGFQRPLMARLDATTAVADSFDPRPSAFVTSITVQADGKILVGGPHFNRIGGQTRNRIARLDPTTGLADSFDPNANNPVNAIKVQADGKILAGGSFTSIGGQTRNRIARLEAETGLADSFDPNASDAVNAIAVAPNGKILVGGLFLGVNGIGGQTRNYLAQINPTTGLADLFDPNANGEIMAIAPQADGKALVGGSFTTLAPNGGPAVTRNRIARLETKPSTLGNISTRVRIQTGDNAMIGGFIITGTQPKTVIVRGVGPSLPVPGALADPVIEVHGQSGELLATNDNWRDGLYAQQVAETLPPAGDLESALHGTINPGAYTVVVRGTNNSTGIGLFEVYDLDRAADSQLANISTRGFVETGDNVLIGGTILVGSAPGKVLFRAIGPSLTNFGVPNALGDPVLELYDGNGGLIAVNYNWRDDQEAELLATGIPPSHDLEAAIVREFAPGNYTAIVRGLNNTTGMALVEAYGLN